MLYGARPARRRDAQRNRAAIVEAAVKAMTGRASVVPMPEIARRAGVGQATLYRHFPDRRALTAAVVHHHMERLEHHAALVAPPAFRDLLRQVLCTLVVMRPLVLLAQRLDESTRERYQQRVIAALSGPLRRAQEHGHARPGAVPADLALMFRMVLSVADAADAERAIDLLIDGLFPGGDEAEPP
ncbi:transcriptional regulator [Virgisporangium aliadipatigenens]|uniref:Transcriptional regulator n=1 Tax=Virgisporangium aliadipatigenens TaxID=741659 RepID=A0A8J4DMI5_9ACTN|nr:TetR/AcrR family transcriptional regulator [Virgisporangium aliadipatigenens]GIJ43419.1 transcriptional regulator [Virgisporangium aliadipatigenens]